MINGIWYDGTGREIDMNHLEGLQEAKTINITIEGDVDKLNINGADAITVNGNVGKVHTGSGDIICDYIKGDAQTGSGDIHSDVIEGDAQTGSGNIYVNEVGGQTSAGTGTIYEGGIPKPNTSKRSGNVFVNTSIESVLNSISVSGASGIISGGFTMSMTSDGKKHLTLTKDCTVDGRRIRDMSESELKRWIDSMAAKGKIVTIRP